MCSDVRCLVQVRKESNVRVDACDVNVKGTNICLLQSRNWGRKREKQCVCARVLLLCVCVHVFIDPRPIPKRSNGIISKYDSNPIKKDLHSPCEFELLLRE